MEDISADELKSRIQKKESLHIVDVREDWEYEEKNIGAINIPLNSLPSRIQEINHLRTEELIVHCRSGARGNTAKKFLSQQGFNNVRNLIKGIDGYMNS